MLFRKNKKVDGIARETLKFILEVSKSTHPREFAGLLCAEKGVISEVYFLPGTESSNKSAVMQLHNMPNIPSVGSVHSHPSPNRNPSKQDLIMFARTGDYHIIVGMPYWDSDWTCYNAKGQIRELPVLDVKLEEEDLEEDYY